MGGGPLSGETTPELGAAEPPSSVSTLSDQPSQPSLNDKLSSDIGEEVPPPTQTPAPGVQRGGSLDQDLQRLKDESELEKATNLTIDEFDGQIFNSLQNHKH